MRLNLGCGTLPEPGWVNVDLADCPGVDVVQDLDVAPWPWPDGSVAEIQALDVFEHVDRPVLFMVECHRVLRPGGQLLIRTPHFQHWSAYADPTHKRFPTPLTFDYWIRGTEWHERYNAAYGGVTYVKAGYELDQPTGQQTFTLRKVT
jgi:SAM-dependent methyltransferase